MHPLALAIESRKTCNALCFLGVVGKTGEAASWRRRLKLLSPDLDESSPRRRRTISPPGWIRSAPPVVAAADCHRSSLLRLSVVYVGAPTPMLGATRNGGEGGAPVTAHEGPSNGRADRGSSSDFDLASANGDAIDARFFLHKHRRPMSIGSSDERIVLRR